MKLIFVYNAKAGVLNGMLDSLHKTVSPDTYDCGLCAITHGFFTMDKEWRAWLKALPMESVFYHKPDFLASYPQQAGTPLPLIATDDGSGFNVLIGATEFKRLKTVNDLIARLEELLPR